MKYSKEQIQEWKAKWGDLFEISVEGKSCVLHKPTRRDLSYASVVKDPIKLSEVMLKQLWVAGDAELQEQDDLFMAVVSKMEDVLKVKEAEIKKTLTDAEVPGAEDDDCPAVLYLDTLLRYYMHVDPWTLSDEEWAWTLRYLLDIRKMENKANGQRT